MRLNILKQVKAVHTAHYVQPIRFVHTKIDVTLKNPVIDGVKLGFGIGVGFITAGLTASQIKIMINEHREEIAREESHTADETWRVAIAPNRMEVTYQDGAIVITGDDNDPWIRYIESGG